MTEKELELLLLRSLRRRFPDLHVAARKRLRYGAGATQQQFEVDILIQDKVGDQATQEAVEPPPPSVVIEIKSGGIHTHDLMAYSAKANLHRTLYGYLRYGLFVAGDKAEGVSAKWLWHGHEFDFMFCCTRNRPSRRDLRKLSEVVSHEIQISRRLEKWVSQKRGPYPNLLWRKAIIA